MPEVYPKTESDVLMQLKMEGRELCRQIDDGESVDPHQVMEYLLHHRHPRDPQVASEHRTELLRFVEAVAEESQPDALIFPWKENR